MDVWSKLGIFESTDVIKRYYAETHQRTLNTGAATQILAAFVQAREYFEIAAHAGETAKPLVQYYGVLSLARAIVLFLSRDPSDSKLSRSHGLTTIDWPQSVGNGIESLRVRALGAGAFIDLLTSTGNEDQIFAFTGPYPSRLIIRQRHDVAGIPDREFLLMDVLARLPDLREMYEECFDETAHSFRAFLFALPGPLGHADIDLFPGKKGLPSHDEIRRLTNVNPEIFLQEAMAHNFLPHQPHVRVRSGYNEIHGNGRPPLPKFDCPDYGSQSLIAPFPDDVHLCRLGRFFLLSYFLGMLARYHPTQWLQLRRIPKRGDFLSPLLVEATKAIQVKFPLLALEALQRRIPSYAASTLPQQLEGIRV